MKPLIIYKIMDKIEKRNEIEKEIREIEEMAFYSKITDNPKVVELLKKRNEIEKEIKEIEEMALVMYELVLLQGSIVRPK